MREREREGGKGTGREGERERGFKPHLHWPHKNSFAALVSLKREREGSKKKELHQLHLKNFKKRGIAPIFVWPEERGLETPLFLSQPLFSLPPHLSLPLLPHSLFSTKQGFHPYFCANKGEGA